MTTTTVLSGPERRRRWSAAEKVRMVEESVAPEASVAEVARRHDVHPNLLHAWRRQARTGTLVRGRDLEMARDDGCRFARVEGSPRALATEPDLDEARSVKLDVRPVRSTPQTPEKPASVQILFCNHRPLLRV